MRAMLTREQVREQIEAGRTPHEIQRDSGNSRPAYLLAIEEEARAQGELGAFSPTPETVVTLRDERRMRWERIAARVLGDSSRTTEVRRLYDDLKGEGASRLSYTGRGRRFPGMATDEEPVPVAAERRAESPFFGVEGERPASDEYLGELDVLRVGALAQVKEYLEQHLYSNRFYVEGDRALLELPNRTDGPPDHVLLVWFRVPEAIAIGGPSGGSRMGLHAIPAGWDATLCRIPTASWKGGTRYRPGREVECRWCLVRLLAAEVIRGAPLPEVTQQVPRRKLMSEKSDPPLYPLQMTRKEVLKSGAVLMDFQENKKPESRSRITTRVIQDGGDHSEVTIYIGREKWGPPFRHPFPEIPSPQMVWDLTLDKIST